MSENFLSWAKTRSAPSDRAELLTALEGGVAEKLSSELAAIADVTRTQLLSWLVQCLDTVIGPPPLVLPLQPALRVLLETMLYLHPLHGGGREEVDDLKSLTDLKSNNLSQTLPIVSTALLDGVLKSDAFIECAGAAAGGMPRRWVDLTLLDPFTTLELLLQVLTVYSPCFTYPLTALLGTIRQYYWYSVGTVMLHSATMPGEWSEDFVRSLFKIPDLKTVAAELEAHKKWKEEQQQAGKKGSKKTRKLQKEQLAPEPKLTGNQRVPLNPATLVALVELSTIMSSSESSPGKKKFSSFLGVSSVLVLDPLHKLLTTLLPEAKRPSVSERGLVTVQRLLESNLKFQNIVRGDSSCASVLMSRFSETLYGKLGPAALANSWVDPGMVGHAAELWQQFLTKQYTNFCESRQRGKEQQQQSTQRKGKGDSSLNAASALLSVPEVAKISLAYRPILTPALWLKVFTETIKVAKRAATANPLPLGALMMLRILTSRRVAPWLAAGRSAQQTLQPHRAVVVAHIVLALQHLSQFVIWSNEPIGSVKAKAAPSSAAGKKGGQATATSAVVASAAIPSELYFDLCRDIFKVLASEQVDRGFDIPLLPPLSAAYANFIETALTPIQEKPATAGGGGGGGKKGGKGKNNAGGDAGGSCSSTHVPEHEMLPAHVPRVLQFLLSLLTATGGAKKKVNVPWWGALCRKIATSAPLLHCLKVNQEMVRLLAAACHHGTIQVALEVPVLAGGAVLRNSIRQHDLVALALCRRVCTKVSALRRTKEPGTGSTAIPMSWVEDLCLVLRDDTKPVHADAVVSLAATLTGGVEPGSRSGDKITSVLSGLGRLNEPSVASSFKADKAASMSLVLLQRMIQSAKADVEESSDAARQKQAEEDARAVKALLVHEEQRAKNHKATIEERRIQLERHNAFTAVMNARTTAIKTSLAVKAQAAAEAQRLKREAALNAEKAKLDAKAQQQDDSRRLKAQQFIWAEKNLAAHGDFLRSLDVPLHKVLEVMTQLRKLHPTPKTLGLISQQQVLELLVCKMEQGAKEPADLKPYSAPTAGDTEEKEGKDEEGDGEGERGNQEGEEGMVEWFSDDGFDFWSAVEGEKEEGGVTGEGSPKKKGDDEEEVDIDLREVAAKFSYHKRCAFLLNLFDFNCPEESAVPYKFLKTVVDATEAPRAVGWTNAAHCFFSLVNKSLVTKTGTGPKSTISLTPLGWAYHANYADPTETYTLHQLKVQEMIQQRSTELDTEEEEGEEQTKEQKMEGPEQQEEGQEVKEDAEAEDDCVYFMDDIF